MLGILRKLGRTDRARAVWLGTAAATVLSMLVAVGLTAAGAGLEGSAEVLFEGFTMALAASILTWMVFWMQRQGRFVRQGLESKVRQAVSREQNRGLFLVAFVAVLREGIELALFLTAAALASSERQSWTGGILGLAVAVAAGYALFASTVKLDVRRFFQVTGAILLLFAAGLVARSVHEFVEIGWLPALIEKVWDTAAVLNDQSVPGQVAKSLLGYSNSPTLAEVIGYTAYLAVVLSLLWRTSRKPSPVTRDASHV
jgi:high-affinity iron transporter